MTNTFLKCTWNKIKNQLIFAIQKVSDIKLLRLHLPDGSSTATAWQKRSPNFLPLHSRYPPTYSLFLQSIQTELTSKGHLFKCQSRTFRSRPGGEGGMVPLKGNLWNLVERSILGCWARKSVLHGQKRLPSSSFWQIKPRSRVNSFFKI